MAKSGNPKSSDELMELKRLEMEAKNKERQQKIEKRKKKMEDRQRKKFEKLRKKYAKKGIKLPEHSLKREPKTEPKAEIIAKDIPEAEVITAADVWTPQSARQIDDIQKRIDRMDQKSIHSLKERYKSRYGEDLEVPDIYETKPSIEVETAEKTGELTSPVKDTKGTMFAKDKKTKKPLFGGKDKKKKEKVKFDRPMRFLDYRSFFYLKNTKATDGGGGKKAIFALIDIILNILLFIIKFPATIYYVIADRRERKMMEAMSESAAQPNPSS